MAPEREPRIRELIKLFVGESDPEKRRILAADLERLLTHRLEDPSRPVANAKVRDD